MKKPGQILPSLFIPVGLALITTTAPAAPGCPMPGTSYGNYPAPLYPDPALYPHPVHGVPGSGGYGLPGYAMPLGLPGPRFVQRSWPPHGPYGMQGPARAHVAQPATQTPARGTTNAAAPNVVNITNMRFGAGTVTVKAGSTVTWQQSDDMPHTVSGEGWGSGTLNRGERFSHTFDKPGRYTYTCRFHPHMSAVVIVE